LASDWAWSRLLGLGPWTVRNRHWEANESSRPSRSHKTYSTPRQGSSKIYQGASKYGCGLRYDLKLYFVSGKPPDLEQAESLG
jgi:hypothetical protein